MPVRLLMDVRHRGNAKNRKQDDAGGNTPTAIGFGGNVAIDVVRHGLNVIEIGTRAKG
jgi:hypothetical protein